MNTILKTNAAVESVRQAYDGKAAGEPDPRWVRGVCPLCGAPVVSNCYSVGGRGFMIIHECWSSLQEPAACTYRKVL